MNKQAKLLLSVLGIAALVIPAVLLIVNSRGMSEAEDNTSTNRTINQESIQETIDQYSQNQPRATVPSPIPSPSSLQSTESAQPNEQIINPPVVNQEGNPTSGL